MRCVGENGGVCEAGGAQGLVLESRDPSPHLGPLFATQALTGRRSAWRFEPREERAGCTQIQSAGKRSKPRVWENGQNHALFRSSLAGAPS